MIYFLLVILLLILITVGFWFFDAERNRKALFSSLELRLLLIRLPQKEKTPDNQNPLQEINSTGQLFSILSNSGMPFAMEVAVKSVGEDINFYLAVPEGQVESVTRSVQGIWSEAEVMRVDDYNIFVPEGAADGVYLQEKTSFALPIRTFSETNLDTFLPILNNFTKLSAADEGMSMQIIVKPAPKSAGKSVSGYIYRLRQGGKLHEVLSGGFKIESLAPSEKKEKDKIPEPKIVDETAVKLLEQKILKPLFSVNVRLIVSSKSGARTKELLDGLMNSFNQFSGHERNEFKFSKINNPEKFSKFVFRQFDDSQSMILSSDELGSIFHLPIAGTNIPKINWLKSREAPPPSELPKGGLFIGESFFRGERKPIFISDDDRRRHVYIVGQTGTGKSNLLTNLALSDILRGKGVAVIDPHGDLVESILASVPEERRNDVIVFDPGDIQNPVGLNMLEYSPEFPEQKTFIVNELLGILDKLYDMKTVGGPMFEQYTRNAILLLMEDMASEPATLMEMPRVFTDAEYRARKLARISNPTVIDFWEKEAVKATGEHSLANMSTWITSKFTNFIANDYVRPIIGQPKSSFNFREIMDSGKILLVNLSKGRIGDINANLLGMVIVGKILMAALSRVDIPDQEKRRDFNLYIDEFQNFTTDSIAIILSEARKYRLNLVIAHQFIAQLTEKIRDAVFGNVGSIIAFRVGTPDAEFLEKQFEPVFLKNDLINIDNFNAYVKLLIFGQTSKPFNIKTIAAPSGDRQVRESLKEQSRRIYGKNREEIEAETLKRLRG
ncbi:MAG: type IV secretion system DNA-binding domain-containing protein [Candidatus Colwellbacteria bacterium]|nr:type IV secretion system DNA-binding domain-containing protein [Candidatus Colwellbacteria bacterium]